MKKLRLILYLIATMSGAGLIIGPGGALISGCTSTQQTATYKTLWSLETTATETVNGYYALVIQGKLSTNSVPEVSRRYNQFQAAMVTAVDLARNNTNAIAPASLAQESADLISFIGSLTRK